MLWLPLNEWLTGLSVVFVSVLCLFLSRQCVPVANTGKPVLRSACALTMAPATPLMALANVSQAGLETTVHRVRTCPFLCLHFQFHLLLFVPLLVFYPTTLSHPFSSICLISHGIVPRKSWPRPFFFAKYPTRPTISSINYLIAHSQ